MLKKIIFCTALISLLALGGWQIQRYIYKTAIISQLKANMEKAPESVSSVREITTNKKFKLKGRFINKKPIYHYALKKNTPGYEIMVPFELSASKEYVLVNSGWSPSKRAPKLHKGVIEISGLVVDMPRKYFLHFQNDPIKNIWFDLSPKTLSEHLSKDVSPILLLLDTPQYLNGNRASFDIAQIPNNHLGYVFVWFSLAISLVVICIYKTKNQK